MTLGHWQSLLTLHVTQCSVHFDKPQKNEIHSIIKVKKAFQIVIRYLCLDFVFVLLFWHCMLPLSKIFSTVKIKKIGTPEIITIIVLQLEQLDFTVQYCVQKMQTE